MTLLLAAAASNNLSENLSVAPPSPTFTDANGAGGDSYTIPTAPGVLYRVNGVEVGVGTYTPQPGQAVTVTAEATEGYVLSGADEWQETFSALYNPPTLTGLHDAIQALSPVGYWPLSETSGNAIDHSGYGRDGHFDNVTRAGDDGFALFGGSGRVTIQNHPDFWNVADGGITVFALAKPTESAEDSPRALIGIGSSARPDWALRKTAIGAANAAYWANSGSTSQAVASSGAFASGQWQAVAAVISTDPPALNVYVDGTMTTSTPTALTVGYKRDPLYIGSGPYHDRWTGSIAHVAIFRGRLTEMQIESLESAARSEGLIP